jgi:hypothetical protein
VSADDARPHTAAQRLWDVAPFVTAICAFALLAVWNEARGLELWRNYALSGLMIGIPSTYAIAKADWRVPHYVQWAIVFALSLHYFGGSMASTDPFRLGLFRFHGVNGAYHTFDWWDHLTHGMGILASTMGIAYAIEIVNVRRGLAWKGWHVAVLAIMSGMAAGVGVELYEYGGKTFFQTIDQGGYRNTVSDLQYNLWGATVGAVVGVAANRVWFTQHIRDQYPLAPKSDRPRLPGDLRAFVVFIAVPGIVSVVMALRGFWVPGNDLDDALYEGLLRTLVGAAILGAAAGGAATLVRGKSA